MPLDIVAGTPGLWRDPHWTPGMPGVYALVAGASAYTHMEGGSAPAPDSFGLGQLVSSASTAAAVFEWLRRDFRRADLPVVWCLLLLAPSADEKARLDAEGLAHYARPDNDGLRKAIQLWTGNVPREAPAAPRCRTLFFFSGHGVQSNWNALLLPSDYLDPAFGQPQLENCIATGELRKWMDEHPAGEHLALLDACRNEFSPLASKGATANSCFPINPPGGLPPRTAATLASTSPNTVAYQVAGRPFTFFGEAVLEALRGITAQDAQVEFRELVDYVKPRVNALLRQAGGTALEQTVRPRIDGDDALVITELTLPAPAPPDAHEPTTGAAPPLPPAAAPRPGLAGAGRRPRTPTAAARDAADARFDAALATYDPMPLDELRQIWPELHRRMGHEYASFLWQQGFSLRSLVDGSILQDAATVQAVQRNEDSSLLQVDLLLAPQTRGVLLVFEGAENVQRERLAMALPTDGAGPVPIRLLLTIARPDPSTWPRLQKIEARLGPAAASPHYAYLWELSREADLGSLGRAARQADPQKLVQPMDNPQVGTTAATAGLLLLARAGQLDRVQDAPRKLMQSSAQLPDGAVLWAEALRQAVAHGETQPFGVADPQAEIATALASLLQRGLPFFADSLDLADTLLRQALRHAPHDARLQAVAAWLAQVFEVATPGGHFSVLAGLPRPAWLPGTGALGVDEMLALLRGAA